MSRLLFHYNNIKIPPKKSPIDKISRKASINQPNDLFFLICIISIVLLSVIDLTNQMIRYKFETYPSELISNFRISLSSSLDLLDSSILVIVPAWARPLLGAFPPLFVELALFLEFIIYRNKIISN